MLVFQLLEFIKISHLLMHSPTEDQFPDELQVTNFELASSILYPSLHSIVASLPKFVPSGDMTEPSVTLKLPQLITERQSKQCIMEKESIDSTERVSC